jgi:uncharacterized membrane protein YsdA (DUF1294 family)
MAKIVGGVTAWQAYLLGISAVTFSCYGYDKLMACTGRRRIPEMFLHLLEAAGGTPGAFVGQLLFRHKTRDRRFRLVFWFIVTVQVVLLFVYFRDR